MADATFPISFPNQLRQHLRALRKQRGLTQAQLGALIGVSQARIAEIEANPGLVNSEQLIKLLATLGATLMLRSTASSATPESTDSQSKRTPSKDNRASGESPTPAPVGAGTSRIKGAHASSAKSQPDAATPSRPTVKRVTPSRPVTASMLIPRPKKGTW